MQMQLGSMFSYTALIILEPLVPGCQNQHCKWDWSC